MAEQLISTSLHHTLPESYVRSQEERPRLYEVVPDANIPVVDLANPDRATVVSQAKMAVKHDFLPPSPEKKANVYSDDPARIMRRSSSVNVRKENMPNWHDYLRVHRPLEQFVPEYPANPPSFRPISSEPVIKRDNDMTTLVAPPPVNMDMLPKEAANVDTLTTFPHVVSNVNVTSPELPSEVDGSFNDTSLDLEGGIICPIIQTIIPRASAPTRGKVAATLFVLSSFTTLFGLTVLFHMPAAGPVFSGYKESYYIILAVILATAGVEMAMVYWLAFSTGQHILALAKVTLPFGYLILIVLFALGGFTVPFRKR